MAYYDIFEADKAWWEKIIVKIPDDEIWAWIEELHEILGKEAHEARP